MVSSSLHLLESSLRGTPEPIAGRTRRGSTDGNVNLIRAAAGEHKYSLEPRDGIDEPAGLTKFELESFR